MPLTAPLPPELREQFADPAFSLRAFARFQDLETGKDVPFDPTTITHDLQNTILSYWSNPPLDANGFTRWLVVLKYRQAGSSTTSNNAAYCKTAYIPGWDHVTVADNRDRADYLHQRTHFMHSRWPEEIRSPTMHAGQVRQLRFDPAFGGLMRVLSAEAGGAGIGQTPDSMHGSECPLWPDLDETISYIQPSWANRRHVLVVFESTPMPAHEPSSEEWQRLYATAAHGEGRWTAAFFPFWDGKLNRRPWPEDWTPDIEELRLMEQYGPMGLEWENLAFRRHQLTDVPKLKRNPEFFGIFYPFDDLTCWQQAGGGVISSVHLERHRKSVLVPWRPTENVVRFEDPKKGEQYVIGVDPAGRAARDHAAFQVLRINRGRWSQVAVFAAAIEPDLVFPLLMATAEAYNNAMIVVEANGVGEGILTPLKLMRYRNVYHGENGKPGLPASGPANDRYLEWLVDALQDELVLRDSDTVAQLGTYRADKRIEDPVTSEMLRGTIGKKRRERHHWDKVSALQMAVAGARRINRAAKPIVVVDPNSAEPPRGVENVLPISATMTADQWHKYREALKSDATPKRFKIRYRPLKKR